jgi:prolyl-tRNA synthetase
MNSEFSKRGVQNCYFPMFVTEAALAKEESHLEGFTAEVAWITKSGKSDLKEKIAVRPTSETVMYPAYAEWIRSHRDLPLKLNQWCNVVRWEFKSPTPFLRTREFLWQEGHTAFATKEAASAEVYDILDVYARTYAEVLAVPTIKGVKTEKEKFPGGDFTTTVEAYIPFAGRGIQGATSHGLGQNFAKMFGIQFEAGDGSKGMPWQNSWGFTTRSIGVAVMVHGDDIGLVLPPRVAKVQAVFVPIVMTGERERVEAAIESAMALLTGSGVRTYYDNSDLHNSGFKRSHWEQKGVPLRLEIGPKDVAKGAVLMCVRDSGEKRSVPLADLVATVQKELVDMHARMLAKATAFRDAHISKITTWPEFVPALDRRHLVLAPFCRTVACEEDIKEAQKQAADDELINEGNEQFQKITAAAKTLCIPLEQEPLAADAVCFRCGKAAVTRCLFGRSF